MEDDYGPRGDGGDGGNENDNNGDDHHVRAIFDITAIHPTPQVLKGIVRPIKYLTAPEFAFVADANRKQQLRLDDGHSDGEFVSEFTTTMKATLKSKGSWSSDDSDGGALLGHSLTTEPPIQESRVMASLVSPSPYPKNPQPNFSQWKIRRDLSLSPTNDGTSLRSSHPTSLSTFHFHRRLHHALHEHHQSVAPTPFTCTKTRKYMLSNQVPDPALVRSQQAGPNLDNLTNELQDMHIVRPSSPWVYNPKSLREALRRWAYDRDFMEDAERAEQRNRWRGIDMNDGWTRAQANAWNFAIDIQSIAPHFEGGPEMRMKIMEGFNRFSLWSQLEPIEWDVEELKGMFDVVFVGEGLGNSGWARKPGTWWAVRRKVFDGHRGRSFLEEIDLWMEDIVDGWEGWKREHTEMLYTIEGLKRQASSAKVEVNAERDRLKKRFKRPKMKSEQVMSNDWRARRRMQEKKAGRWTDGTLRMDRMWAEFHWVLNSDDPMGIWPSNIFKGHYY